MLRRGFLASVASAVVAGCLDDGPVVGVCAVLVPDEHIPRDIEMVPSDDERIDDVGLIQDILEMIEQGQFGEPWGSEDFPEVDYVSQTGVNPLEPENARRFEETRDALERLPFHEGQPNQAPRGPNPSGRYVSHAGFVAAFRYSVEE